MTGATSAGQPVAFFDVDGTLCDTTIAHYFRYFMFRRLPPLRRHFWYAAFLAKCGYYLLLDRFDRGRLNVIFYRNYAGLPAGEIRAQAEECERDVVVPRWFEGATRCLAEHRSAGREIVLVTGSLDFIVEPLARRVGAADVLAARLIEVNGRFTGALDGPPLGGAQKARLMREYAERHQIDLARSFAYGDSLADFPMLEAVGRPNVVNPDRRLASLAAARGWPVHRWSVNSSLADAHR